MEISEPCKRRNICLCKKIEDKYNKNQGCKEKNLNKGITKSRLIRKIILHPIKLISKIKVVREKLRLGITKIKAAKKKSFKIE